MIHGTYLMSSLNFSLSFGDLKNVHWWMGIGLPLAIGLCYLGIGIKFNGNAQDHKIVIAGFVLLTLIIFPFNYFVSIVPAIIVATWLILATVKKNET